LTRVLVVEDDVNLCLSIADVLMEFGFEVAVAGDGAKALHELAEADPLPSVIVLDLHMPNMNGWELKDKLANSPRYRDIPIVFMSADSAALAQMEQEDKIQKPFELQDFLHHVLRHTKAN
jgi:CheY-like chemotaxis protein